MSSKNHVNHQSAARISSHRKYCNVFSLNSISRSSSETMVEMSEISTPTSSSCNVVHASVEPPEVEEADFSAAAPGCANPSFNAHEDTVC